MWYEKHSCLHFANWSTGAVWLKDSFPKEITPFVLFFYQTLSTPSSFSLRDPSLIRNNSWHNLPHLLFFLYLSPIPSLQIHTYIYTLPILYVSIHIVPFLPVWPHSLTLKSSHCLDTYKPQNSWNWTWKSKLGKALISMGVLQSPCHQKNKKIFDLFHSVWEKSLSP